MIADIGGYTTYLSGVELEHSADVLGDLLQTVVDALSATLRLAKLEGDAVFSDDVGEADMAALVDTVRAAPGSTGRRVRP